MANTYKIKKSTFDKITDDASKEHYLNAITSKLKKICKVLDDSNITFTPLGYIHTGNARGNTKEYLRIDFQLNEDVLRYEININGSFENVNFLKVYTGGRKFCEVSDLDLKLQLIYKVLAFKTRNKYDGKKDKLYQ